MFEVEDPVVNITDDEEIVLFAVAISEAVEDAEDAVEVIEATLLAVLEVVEISLDVVDGTTVLLLELLGASLILRAPLMPLLARALPSFCFM